MWDAFHLLELGLKFLTRAGSAGKDNLQFYGNVKLL